jgi:hypothetical protein
VARGLTVVRPGSRVGVKAAGIADAYVLEVILGAGLTVSYRVSWWIEGERYTDVLDAGEIDPDPPGQMTVGFRRPGA